MLVKGTEMYVSLASINLPLKRDFANPIEVTHFVCEISI